MSAPKMPQMYITKYNRFVDNIVGRINRILGKSYDPVRVKLQSNTQSNKTKSKKKTQTKRKNANRKRNSAIRNKMGELSIARAAPESAAATPTFVLVAKSNEEAPKNASQRANNSQKNKKQANKKSAKKAPKARATLFGLSTIKRDGDVVVNMQSDHTNVKTDFLVGPLTLRVERQIGNGARRELKSATATTAEMHGKLNLKIVHGGAATLQWIKVLQPKQMRVDSTDNHDKTKEFVWKKSANIAGLVAKELTAAARSMLRPRNH